MPQRFLIFGHRGSPKRFAENTMAAFEETLRAGADGFETDLRLLSDKTAVLYHDDELEEEDFETRTYAHYSEKGLMIERLSDLARFAGRTTMILEIKRSKWEEPLLEIVQEWPNIVIASFDHSIVTNLRNRGITVPLGITFHGYIVDVAEYAARIGASWCFPNYRFVDEETVAALHEKGITVVPWTANREREWQRLYDVGCDGVITDFPAEAVDWRQRLP